MKRILCQNCIVEFGAVCRQLLGNRPEEVYDDTLTGIVIVCLWLST